MFNFGLNPLKWGRGLTIGTTEINDYTIDTCDTMDCGYETAIKKGGGNWIVVEYYADSQKAAKGHKRWCKFCERNPKYVYSVQLCQTEKF